MVKSKRYDDYKDSGVEWIEEIPEHWEIKRLKDFSNIARGTVDKAVNENEIPIYLVQYTNVYKKMKQSESDNDYLPITVTANELKNSKVLKGDILVTASSETAEDIGRSSVIYEELSNHVFGADVLRIRISEYVVVMDYKKYLMENHIYLNKFNSLSRGVTRFRFGMNDFKIIKYLIPPTSEQKAIASFLDHKTSEIDALITDKEKLIELLKEQRQAIISEAVTKGLNPDVKMKDSGVEWIGEVPEHWSMVPVKHRFDVQLGKMLQNNPNSEADVSTPYIKALYVLWGKVDTTGLPEMWASPADIRQYGVKEGDLLVCEGGEAGRAGIIVSVPSLCIIQNAVHRVRGNGADVRFLLYVLHAVSSGGWFDVLCNKATIAHFTRKKLAELQVPLPASIDEQQTIAAFLDHKTSEIDTLITKEKTQIEKLKSYRQSLIYEAVTGKIDVRDWSDKPLGRSDAVANA